MSLQEKIHISAYFILTKITSVPDVAVILGSGLGDFAESLENKIVIDYKEIPNFPVSTVEGHKGRLVFGRLNGKKVLAMQGRFHYYEGYSMTETVFPVQVFAKMGIKKLIVTAAAGAINTDYQPGDLVILTDHIKLTADCPLRGANLDGLGERFFDMTHAYAPAGIELAKKAAQKCGIHIQTGVYAYMGGPNYETPAEIRMLRILGADVVGMSTVPEVIAANHAGISVLGIVCCSNMAAGVLDKPLEHAEVMQIANQIGSAFQKLIAEIIAEL